MLDITARATAPSGEVRRGASSACPCCGGSSAHVIHRVPSIPVHSCVLLDTRDAALNFPRRDLELAFCDDCGFAYNRVFDEASMRYSTDFEESQHFSDTFSGFAARLAAEIAARCETEGKRVLEIGCGKGEFLAELCRVGRSSGIGIDPGYRADPGRPNKGESLEFIVDHFGPRHADLLADVVLCRHTLEHIPGVARFIADIRSMIGERRDTWVVFETPDFKRVLGEAAFWDIYYEHCSYFSAGTHARLFREHDFEVTDLALAYDDQYIIQYARPSAGNTRANLPLEADTDEMRALAATFVDRVRQAETIWRERLADMRAAGRRVVLWGGGSKAVSFLTTMGLTDEVQAAVDINPYKQGKFTPGTGHPVIAPGSLLDEPPDLVIVMNPIYVPEVGKALSRIGLSPEITSV
jgi:SAM-dependent methyltransferase